MESLIEILLTFGFGAFVLCSENIIGRRKRFKGRSPEERSALAVVLIFVVLGPIALVYCLWKTGRL